MNLAQQWLVHPGMYWIFGGCTIAFILAAKFKGRTAIQIPPVKRKTKIGRHGSVMFGPTRTEIAENTKQKQQNKQKNKKKAKKKSANLT